MTADALEILSELIACDTQNPPRQIDSDHPVFGVVQRHLGSQFEFEFENHGSGCVNLLAVRNSGVGNQWHDGPWRWSSPKILFNVHLDTVPAGQGWNGNPLEMRVMDGQAVGRGACDIKGAAACLIAAAAASDAPAAILFTTDEEGSGNCCVRNFCQSQKNRYYEMVIVAEPTGCQAVAQHRGYLSVTGRFTGVAGHSSQFQQLVESANHRAIRWAESALQTTSQFEAKHLAGESVCFNIGRIDGGTKNNVIAADCRLTWSMRPPPGTSNEQLLELMIGSTPACAEWETTFAGSAFPAIRQKNVSEAVSGHCDRHQLPVAPAVDFWTEAAIFSDFGMPALVFGPGDIAQAHAVDEWVAVDQLERATGIYRQLLDDPLGLMFMRPAE